MLTTRLDIARICSLARRGAKALRADEAITDETLQQQELRYIDAMEEEINRWREDSQNWHYRTTCTCGHTRNWHDPHCNQLGCQCVGFVMR